MNRNLLRASAVAAVIVSTLPAVAHEMFLKPLDFTVEPGTTAVVQLVNGTFERSDNTIDRDRMIDVTVHGGGQTQKPEASQWQDRNLASFLRHEIGGEGTYVLGVSTRPRIITLTADEFTDYLDHDGVTDTLKDFEANGGPQNVRERYSKHVRTILQVGDDRTDEHQEVLGYPVEIILEDNPYEAKVGDEIGFRVLAEGEPLGGQLVYASYDGYHQSSSGDSHERAQTLRTGDDGKASFKVTHGGVWYLTLIHMEKLADDPDVDYESNWATVTFKIG